MRICPPQPDHLIRLVRMAVSETCVRHFDSFRTSFAAANQTAINIYYIRSLRD